jgi:hypothetical protein
MTIVSPRFTVDDIKSARGSATGDDIDGTSETKGDVLRQHSTPYQRADDGHVSQQANMDIDD